MNRSMNVYLALCSALVASALLLVDSSSAQRPRRPTWGEAVNGLQMSIALDPAKSAPSKTPKFIVALRNAGESDLILNLGFMLGNGKSQYPIAVVLMLTDAQEKSRRLELRGPAIIGGRMDPFVLPIPAGATFSIPADLDKYWAPATQEFEFDLNHGAYSIEARFTGKSVSEPDANLDVKGIALMPYWKGTARSNQLRFGVSSQ